MEVLVLILFVTTFVSFGSLMVHITRLPNRVLKFLAEFHNEKIISDGEYIELKSKHDGFFRILEFFPDETDYPQLYKNEEFDDFVYKAQQRTKYLFVAAIISVALLFTTSGLLPN